MRLLLVEDDPDLSAALARSLDAARYVVDTAEDGEIAHYLGETGRYAAIILDIGLPGMDGLAILQRWRGAGIETPVLLLTARDGWRNKVAGLRLGADDYLTKPFATEEVLARLEVLIRRRGGYAGSALTVGDLVCDLSGRSIAIAGNPVAVSAYEFRALALLAANSTRVVSKTELAEHVYDDDVARDLNAIEALVARLRKKIGGQRIRTRRGHGYQLA